MKEKSVYALTLWLAVVGCISIVHMIHSGVGTSLPDIYHFLLDAILAGILFTPVILQYFTWTELNTHARYDILTGLFNRNAFNKYFDKFLDRGQKFQLVMIDIVKFKQINDTYGHRVGDEVLKIVGERLQSLLRPGEVSARLGGDEFVMLVPGELSDAEYIDLIRQIEAPMSVTGTRMRVGLSVGVSTYPYHGTDHSSLMTAADIAMYHAKNCGFSVFSGRIST